MRVEVLLEFLAVFKMLLDVKAHGVSRASLNGVNACKSIPFRTPGVKIVK